MVKYVLLMMALMAGNAVAQTLPSKDVDTVRSGIGEETLAPVVVKQPVVSASTVAKATAMPAAASGVPVSATGGLTVSATAPADPFTVKNVVVTLSGTTGFDRDAALEQGARQSMPGILVMMGMDQATAVKSVKGLGSAMNFVRSFKVVKETLIPTYVLTADLSFNEAMLRKNFGGKLPVKSSETTVGVVSVGVSATEDASGSVAGAGAETAASNVPLKQWIVRVTDRDPAVVEKVRTNLNAQAATKATYRLITSVGAELMVDTPMNAMDINRVAGHEVMVSEMETALPTATVALPGIAPGIVSGSWQGGSQTTVDAPAAPGAEGTY